MSKSVYTSEVKATIMETLKGCQDYQTQTSNLSQIAASLGVTMKSIIAAISRDSALKGHYQVKPKLKKRKPAE
jgi:Tfp pilus assembly PilM family ATPase